MRHSNMTGTELHEAFHYVASVDPGAVGAGLYWLDTSSDPYVLKRRNVTDDDWVTVGSSGGGGGFTPSHYPVPVKAPDSNTNFATIDSTGASDYYLLSSGAQNDLATWNINLPAGTYTWNLFHFRGSNRGEYHLLIDGADIGSTIDGYNGSGDVHVSAITGIAIAGASPTAVQIKMASKNASSSNYYGLIFESWLIRTGA